MKRVILLICFSIQLGILYSQTSNFALNIHTVEGNILLFTSDIDSIVHDSNNVFVYSKERLIVSDVTEMDSIVLPNETTTPCLFPIEEACLEGWDEGYVDNKGCFIVYRMEDDGCYSVFIGQKDMPEDCIYVRFNSDMEIQSIYSNYGFMSLCEEMGKNQAYFIVNDSLYFKELSPSTSYNQSNNRMSPKTITLPSLNIYRICDAINSGLTIKDINVFYNNGKGYTSTFLANLTIGRIALGLPSPVKLGLSLLMNYCEKRYEDGYLGVMRKYMGYCNPWITDIEDKDAPNYEINVALYDLNTNDKGIFASVRSGVAVRVDDSHVTYDDCDDRLNDHEVKKEEEYKAYLTAERLKKYYLRPYAVVVIEWFELRRRKYLFGGPLEPIISYGDVREIYYNSTPSATTGKVIQEKLTDKSAVVECSYSNVESTDYCGVAVVSDFGEKEYETSSTNGNRSIELTGLMPATNYEYWAYVKCNGISIAGESKYFTTKPPSLAGTWSCTISISSGHTEIWTITLTEDGKGSAIRTDYSPSRPYEVTWRMGTDGKASVHLAYIVSTSQRYSYLTYELSGSVDDLLNPSRIEGNGKYSVGNDIAESSSQLTFYMTK